MRVSSYSKVDAVEQGGVVNSGARGTKDRNLRPQDRGGLVFYSNASIVPIICPIIFKYLVPVIYSTGTPGGVVASGSSLELPRAAAAADTRGQYSTCTLVRYAMRGQQRGAREGGTRERGTGRKRSLGLLVVRQQELG
jgi:hypothetical protein